MGITEELIRMFEKAEEIQKQKPPAPVGFYHVNIPFYNLEGNLWFNKDNQDYIWLPRQDQLQKLTGIVAIPTLLSQFNEFVFGNVGYTTQEMCNFVNSCEQLWLAFVMKKVYEKFWNGKEWVKR